MIAPALGAAVIVAILAGAPAASAQGRADGVVADLPTRPGVTMRYLAVEPDRRPTVAAVLLVGGNGAVSIPDRGSAAWARNGNFLLRARELLRQRGILAIVVGPPSDHRDGLGNWRLSAAHAADLGAMAAEARRRWGVTRVWLIGTSNGTLSAASAAAQLPPGTVDGVVLSATVTRIGRVGRESGALTVNDVALANIRVPTLLLHHRDDACYASPFAGAESLRRRLSGASRVDVVAVAGGDAPRSGPCEPLAPHGFLGVEAQAVDAMVAWMAAGS